MGFPPNEKTMEPVSCRIMGRYMPFLTDNRQPQVYFVKIVFQYTIFGGYDRFFLPLSPFPDDDEIDQQDVDDQGFDQGQADNQYTTDGIGGGRVSTDIVHCRS